MTSTKINKIDIEKIRSTLESAQEHMGQDKTQTGLTLLDEAEKLIAKLVGNASGSPVEDLCKRLRGELPIIKEYYREYHSLLLLDKYPEANINNTMSMLASYIHDNFSDCFANIEAIENTQNQNRGREKD